MTWLTKLALWVVGHVGSWAIRAEWKLRELLPDHDPDADQIDPADVSPEYRRKVE